MILAFLTEDAYANSSPFRHFRTMFSVQAELNFLEHGLVLLDQTVRVAL